MRAHEANSHANRGWERFTQKVIDLVAHKRTSGVVFLAWGSPAQKRCTAVNSTRHLVLKSVHPSPLSAARGWVSANFLLGASSLMIEQFDCGHFKKANEWLEQRYGKDGAIDWNLNVPPEKAGV